MASIVPRRVSSYQLEVQRRASSAKAAHTERLLRDKKLEVVEPSEQQQQPSPQVPKQVKLSDGNSADNNQEEESSTTDADTRIANEDDSIRPATPTALPITADKAKPARHLQHSRKQAATNRDPPLTTARLRQENAALKLQLTQLGNQHECEVRQLKDQLAETTLAHEQVEQSLKKQINELEIRQQDAAQQALKYQAHVESLQCMLQRLEMQAKGFNGSPRKPVNAPQAPSTPAKQSQSHSSVVKPFAWQQERAAGHAAHVAPVPTQKQASFYPTSAMVTPPTSYIASPLPRCIPVPTEEANASGVTPPCPSRDYILPPPLSVKQDQQQRHAPLTKKPSGSLLAYCADMLTSKLTTSTSSPVSTVKPNMKVMPILSPEDDVTSDQIPVPRTLPDPAQITRQPGSQTDEFTAITIL